MSYITSFKFRLGGRGWQQQAHLHTCDAQISKVEANFVPLLLPLPLVNNKRGLDYIKQQQQQQQEFDVRAAFLDCLPWTISSSCCCCWHIITGFDAYFKSLRPKTGRVCGGANGTVNLERNGRLYNCRNPWFRQFWEQHFKCRFNVNSSSSTYSSSSSTTTPETVSTTGAGGAVNGVKCEGNDKLTYYEQEGLVPFVGEQTLCWLISFSFFLIWVGEWMGGWMAGNESRIYVQ